METRISSATQEVAISADRPLVLIGERINPTGKKRLAAALQSGDLEIVRREAVAQVEAGAAVIDVNVGAPGVDEVTLLPEAVRVAMEAVQAPLCLDSSNPRALAAALRVYQGKALINSVTGEASSLESVLPLVKEHGAAVIGLAMDDEGIPGEASKRLAIAGRIVERAAQLGIPREDVVIDCLALTVGTDSRAGAVTLSAARGIRDELGVNITLAASNVSFGMPDRELLSGTFLAVAMASGVTCAIVDVAKIRPVVLAADLILGRDDYGMRYIRAYRRRQRST